MLLFTYMLLSRFIKFNYNLPSVFGRANFNNTINHNPMKTNPLSLAVALSQKITMVKRNPMRPILRYLSKILIMLYALNFTTILTHVIRHCFHSYNQMFRLPPQLKASSSYQQKKTITFSIQLIQELTFFPIPQTN